MYSTPNQKYKSRTESNRIEQKTSLSKMKEESNLEQLNGKREKNVRWKKVNWCTWREAHE